MKFRTEIKDLGEFPKFNYSDKLFFNGSCFSNHISNRLHSLKFQTFSNPFGSIYNPISLLNGFELIFNENSWEEEMLFYRGGLYHSWLMHGSMSGFEKNEASIQIIEKIQNSVSFLKESSHVFITLGTASVYRLIDEKIIVANCHKVPANQFEKSILSLIEIKDSLQKIVHLIRENCGKISIIFTVSPVKHLKDGFVENSMSKARLISAVHEVIAENSDIFYFPSFEIQNDDLRDYRFYESDLLHPNELAIDYIFEKFKDAFFDEQTLIFSEEMSKLKLLALHRPLRKKDPEFLVFVNKAILKIETLKNQYRGINFEEEELLFREYLELNT